jgi:hypothetical protein
MSSVRYGTSHFHQFSSYKFSINLTNKVSLPDHFWTIRGGDAVCLKKRVTLGLS